MDSNKFLKIFLIIILLVNITIIIKINNLENNLTRNLNNNLNHQLNSVRNEISSIKRYVNEIKESYKLVKNTSDEIIGEGLGEYNLLVRLNCSFNKLENNSEVYILYKGDNEDKWQKVKAIKTGGLNYQVDLDLSIKDNYATQVLIVDSNGKKSEDLRRIRLKEVFLNRYHINYHGNGNAKGLVEWGIELEEFNKMKLKEEIKLLEGFKIKSIKAKIYQGNKYIGLKDFKKEMSDEDFTIWVLKGESSKKITGKIIIEFNNGLKEEKDINLDHMWDNEFNGSIEITEERAIELD